MGIESIDVYQLGRHVYDSPSGLACVEGVFLMGGGGEGRERKGERISAFFPFTLSPIVSSFDFCLASARLCLLLNQPQTKNTPK